MVTTNRHFGVRRGRSIKQAARELDAELSARPLEPFTPQEESAMRAFDWALNRVESAFDDARRRKDANHA